MRDDVLSDLWQWFCALDLQERIQAIAIEDALWIKMYIVLFRKTEKQHRTVFDLACESRAARRVRANFALARVIRMFFLPRRLRKDIRSRPPPRAPQAKQRAHGRGGVAWHGARRSRCARHGALRNLRRNDSDSESELRAQADPRHCERCREQFVGGREKAIARQRAATAAAGLRAAAAA